MSVLITKYQTCLDTFQEHEKEGSCNNWRVRAERHAKRKKEIVRGRKGEALKRKRRIGGQRKKGKEVARVTNFPTPGQFLG